MSNVTLSARNFATSTANQGWIPYATSAPWDLSTPPSTTDGPKIVYAQFRDADEGLHYAQARYLMQYLQEEGLLNAFVRRALAQQFGITPAGFQACLDGLVSARWVTVSVDPDGLYCIELTQ